MSLISPLNEIQCLMCGKYFIPNAKHQKYCNKACLQKANIKRRNMYYKNVEKLRKAKSEELKERKQKQMISICFCMKFTYITLKIIAF